MFSCNSSIWLYICIINVPCMLISIHTPKHTECIHAYTYVLVYTYETSSRKRFCKEKMFIFLKHDIKTDIVLVPMLSTISTSLKKKKSNNKPALYKLQLFDRYFGSADHDTHFIQPPPPSHPRNIHYH